MKLSDIKPVRAWGWLYRDPRVLSHGDVTSFEKQERGKSNADQVPVMLMTWAAYLKMKRELEAWKKEAIENNPARVSQRNAEHSQSLQRTFAKLRRKK